MNTTQVDQCHRCGRPAKLLLQVSRESWGTLLCPTCLATFLTPVAALWHWGVWFLAGWSCGVILARLFFPGN